MQEKVETPPNTQIQKVTLLVTMHDFEENDFDAGEWLINVLANCASDSTRGQYGAKAYAQAMQVLSVQNCEIVVANGL